MRDLQHTFIDLPAHPAVPPRSWSRSLWIPVTACTLLAVTLPAARAEEPPAKPAWDVEALFKTPPVHATEDRPAKGLKSFFYEGADYKGKPTWVFAYYGTPAGDPPAGGWPAVVCAHGGGGTAYPQWVRSWNRHGYAAIAMDLEGHLPGGNAHEVEGNFPVNAPHPNAGPARIDYFGDRDLPDDEKWFYHAVADVIRANSLVRSFPEINKDAIGLNGISWGATVACTAAGLDPRFAFAIPVYGCGFIHESDNPGLAQWFPPTHMTEPQFRDYRTKWDPAAHLPNAKMPMLFVTSVADPVFQVDIVSKSSVTAGGKSGLCLRPWMIHAHGSGWEDAVEIKAFADSVVRGGPPLPTVERPVVDPQSRVVRAPFTGEFTEAWVYFTTGKGLWKDRKWNFIQCDLKDGTLVSRQPVPPDTTALLVYGFKVNPGGHRSQHASSEVVVPER